MNTYRQVYCYNCGLMMPANHAVKRDVFAGTNNGVYADPYDNDDLTIGSCEITRVQNLCKPCAFAHDQAKRDSNRNFFLAVFIIAISFITIVSLLTYFK